MSTWRLASRTTPQLGLRSWRAYRLKDPKRGDTEENRAYFGVWSRDREAVRYLVEDLNDRGAP